jgi:hypothetical protein
MVAKGAISALMPDAVGKRHALPACSSHAIRHHGKMQLPSDSYSDYMAGHGDDVLRQHGFLIRALYGIWRIFERSLC